LSGALDLSVVIPAYNESQRLPGSLERIRSFLEGRHRYEIVVVDDGSGDDTAQLAERALGPGHRVLRQPRNRGKGAAVRRGMLAASGERRLMTDADLSTPIEELPRLLERMDAGCDVVIGSRALPGSRIEVHQPWHRENAGRLFNALVRLLVVGGLADTQCGFKLFSARAAEDCFVACLLDGFSFDVEALHVARRRGYRIAELGVVWRNDAASRVTLGRGVMAFADLLRIRALSLLGRYDAPGGSGL
jgi:dolichyl-phosphate beta-glucosyltransferase